MSIELVESIEDEWRGVATYRLTNGRMARFDIRALREYGLAALMRSVGESMPTERVPVMQRGRRIGTLPGDFDLHNIKSQTFLYEPRPGDLRRDGGVWIASNTLGPGDLSAIVGFKKTAPERKKARPPQQKPKKAGQVLGGNARPRTDSRRPHAETATS